jgi:hypothetical protein
MYELQNIAVCTTLTFMPSFVLRVSHKNKQTPYVSWTHKKSAAKISCTRTQLTVQLYTCIQKFCKKVSVCDNSPTIWTYTWLKDFSSWSLSKNLNLSNRSWVMDWQATNNELTLCCLCALIDHHTMKACSGSGNGGIAPLIHDLGTSWRWVVSFTHLLL